MDSSQAWVERDASVVWHGFTQMATYADNRPVIVESGEGRELIDVDGRRYLDAISSLWVTTLGHGVPELDAAIEAQLAKVAHSTMLGNGNKIVVEFAEALAPRVPVDDPRMLFAADGAAAVEQAVKIAFQYWVNLGVPDRRGYLALGDGYHGDTVGSLSVGAGGFGTELFDPLRFPNVVRTPGYSDPGWAKRALDAIKSSGKSLAALVIEPLVQGAEGILVADPADVAAVINAAQEAGMLVICDEVATGFGRTGHLFASDICDVSPDIMCVGKGITGGYLPMSATVASGRVASAFMGEDLGPRTFYHGHSYSGNALAAAVALRHLKLVDEWDVLANVRARASQLASGLSSSISGLSAVTEVRQQGLMAGVSLAPPREGLRWGRKVCAAAVERGVLLRPLGDVIVLVPILTSTEKEIDRIVSVLGEAIAAECR